MIKFAMENKSDSRITLSIGLIGLYLAIVNLLIIPNLQESSIAKTIKDALIIIWGVPTVFLLIFLFLYALSLKYKSPNTIDLWGYNISINSKLVKALFDTGIENYIKGIFSYLVYNIPFYLIDKGVNKIISFVVFFIIVALMLLGLAIWEKKQKLKKL